MPIPQDFQDIMLPLLEKLSDKQGYETNLIIDSLSAHFGLTEDEKSLKYPTGSDYIFRNKTRFARMYLLKAGLIDNPRRSFIKITDLGIEALAKKPAKIDRNFLLQFPKFVEFWDGLRARNKERRGEEQEEKIESQTSQDLIEIGYQKIKSELAEEILSQIKKLPPAFFEKLVVDLLVRMGYGGSISDAGKAIGRSGDGGIDGIIKEDKLGLDFIYIQAKRWENNVGRPEIQSFVGALAAKHSNKGVFITTSGFTKDALDYVGGIAQKVILIDGDALTDLMIENNVGVFCDISYEIKKIDLDYFSEE